FRRCDGVPRESSTPSPTLSQASSAELRALCGSRACTWSRLCEISLRRRFVPRAGANAKRRERQPVPGCHEVHRSPCTCAVTKSVAARQRVFARGLLLAQRGNFPGTKGVDYHSHVPCKPRQWPDSFSDTLGWCQAHSTRLSVTN